MVQWRRTNCKSIRCCPGVRPSKVGVLLVSCPVLGVHLGARGVRRSIQNEAASSHRRPGTGGTLNSETSNYTRGTDSSQRWQTRTAGTRRSTSRDSGTSSLSSYCSRDWLRRWWRLTGTRRRSTSRQTKSPGARSCSRKRSCSSNCHRSTGNARRSTSRHIGRLQYRRNGRGATSSSDRHEHTGQRRRCTSPQTRSSDVCNCSLVSSYSYARCAITGATRRSTLPQEGRSQTRKCEWGPTNRSSNCYPSTGTVRRITSPSVRRNGTSECRCGAASSYACYKRTGTTVRCTYPQAGSFRWSNWLRKKRLSSAHDLSRGKTRRFTSRQVTRSRNRNCD